MLPYRRNLGGLADVTRDKLDVSSNLVADMKSATTPKSTPIAPDRQSGPMDNSTGKRGLAPNPQDPTLMVVVGARAWLRHVMAGATYKLLFASGLFVLNTLAWQFLPLVACPALTLFAITLGALLGAPFDARAKRVCGEERKKDRKQRRAIAAPTKRQLADSTRVSRGRNRVDHGNS